MKKTGIVILNFNGSNFLEIVLDSIKRAKTNCKFSVGVIDNGSRDDDATNAQKIMEDYLNSGKEGFFIRSEKNLGFSGGNNVVMKRFLEDPEITHLCMLNSDVIVTDYWLDYLTEKDYDAVGPVTNATGNEQTVAIDYQAKPNYDAFEQANQFAKYRHNTYEGLEYETEILYFFNTIIARRVVERIGFLDERFFPGSFEDGDYCLRMKNAGFHQMIIRGCYVHHFGSGSFSKLDMSNRVNISNVNRKRFEEKWNTKWESDTWKLLLSCQEDISQFVGKPMDNRSARLLKSSLEATQELIKGWAAGIEWFQSEQYINQKIKEREKGSANPQNGDGQNVHTESVDILPNTYVTRYTYVAELNGRRLLWLVWKKAQMRFYRIIKSNKLEKMMTCSYSFPEYQYPLVPLFMTSAREALKLATHKLFAKLGFAKMNHSQITVSPETHCFDSITEDDVSLRIDQIERKVMIHAPVFTKENERDGYFQRIKRIDETIFSGFLRVYVFEDGKRDSQLKIEKIDNLCYFIQYNSHDEKQRDWIFQWAEAIGLQYIHSVNRFMSDSVNVEMIQLLNHDSIKIIWDVHGSVPEEYGMYGNDVGQKIADNVERIIYNLSDVIVVVNHATEIHLRKKHGETKAQFVVLPIFNIDFQSTDRVIPERSHEELNTVVYCGGVQKWQNIELMQSIIRQTEGKYHYHILVPSPEEFNSYWEGTIPEGVVVESKAPEELNEVYKHCQFGFVLRDDSVVNQVACPTKILEYVVNGVIPVMKSPNIGDFVELGLNYIQYGDLLNDNIPSESKLRKMMEDNFNILTALETEYTEGIARLKKIVSEQLPQKEPVIGIVVTTLDKGGLEQVVVNLYKGYCRNGIKTYLLCQKNILGELAKEIDQESLFIYYDDRDRFLKIIKDNGINILHYHYNTFCMEEMQEHNVRTIYTMHNAYAWKDDYEIREYAKVLSGCNCVIAVSNFVKSYFDKRTNGICKNMITINNGIDFDELRLDEMAPNTTRESLKLKENDIVFSFVASFYPTKGQCGMIGVMEKIRRYNPHIKLLLVGNIGDTYYYDKFMELLRESPAKDSIIHVPYFPHCSMGAFLRSTTDAFILPTLQEGCSNAVLEALYCDCPIIMTDIGNSAEMRKLESCIVVSPPYEDLSKMTNSDIILTSYHKDMPNQDEVVNAMCEMASNLEQFKRSAKLSEKEKEQYNTEKMVESYLEIIRQVNAGER